MPTRIEFNVMTGVSTVIELTPEEIAAAQAATAAFVQVSLPLDPVQILQDALISRGVLVQADITAASKI